MGWRNDDTTLGGEMMMQHEDMVAHAVEARDEDE
jgi:hypothetical protein